MADEKDPVPQIIVSTDDMNAATQKLDEAEEKVEFAVGEYFQRFIEFNVMSVVSTMFAGLI